MNKTLPTNFFSYPLAGLCLLILSGQLLALRAQEATTTTELANYHCLPEEVEKFWQDLSKQKKDFAEDTLGFLQYVFQRNRKQFLRHYAQYSRLEALWQDRHYDCVTGTWYYANLLSYLGYHFEIRETAFHVYLQVKLASGKLLVIESTAKSLISEREAVQKHAHYYVEQEGKQAFNQAISLQALKGLLYYNQAVLYFNQGNYAQANAYLGKAETYYPARRVQHLSKALSRR